MTTITPSTQTGYEGKHRKPGTPDQGPAKLALKARHRKPNRRPAAVKQAAGQ